MLEDPLMLCYLLFLKAMLAKLTRANKFSQCSKAIVPVKNNKMSEIYIEFFKRYMKEGYINNNEIANIDPDNYNEFKNINDVYIGDKTQNYINSIPEGSEMYQQVMEFEKEFRKMCRKFLTECCTQIKEGCDLKEN
ncbi:hypothetical protein TSAR_002888 [Trichomalopsis sarcophagae]|uniref:Uncharacterized protein n=1 Tax=Trichomalopsis sarcophagae TaxID=543379 RepID=A0A232EG52_9HYME|nr:hypothetical protein TSAR_002888 [Trichomalopsis sarcophagae]